MFRRIRIRAGSANFYPHNTPLVLPKHTRQTLPFQSVAVLLVVSPISYADQHNSTSVRGLKVHLPDYERLQSRGWDMNIHHRCHDVTVEPGRSSPMSLFRGVAEAALYCACSFNPPFTCSRVAWSILDCARRTSTFLSCAFREQEDD